MNPVEVPEIIVVGTCMHCRSAVVEGDAHVRMASGVVHMDPCFFALARRLQRRSR